jgi:copper(I)-binding protein
MTLRFEKAGEVKVDVQIAAQAPGGTAPAVEHKH